MDAILRGAEDKDQYRTKCQESTPNTLARKNCIYDLWQDQTLAKSAARFLPFSSSAQILILNPSADGGMPHTRPHSIICLPAYFPEEKLETTMKHEMIHLDQRANPLKWLNLLRRDGWTIEDQNEIKREIPYEYINRCRLNPDTLQCRFPSWKGRYIPLPLFVREDKPELKDVQVRWFDLQDKVLRSFPPTSFTNIYGTNLSQSELEHPFELYAYANE